MSVSSRPDHFFQTDSSLDELNRKSQKSYNTAGDPIKLPSKILAVVQDPDDNSAIYIAEGAATVKRINLSDGKTTDTFKGPAAPVTSLCFSIKSQSSPSRSLFGGCWDKSIWKWALNPTDPQSRQQLPRRLQGHIDFVKCILYIPHPTSPFLLSGGAEGDIIIWDPSTNGKLHVIKLQGRAIQDLAFDPLSDSASPSVFAATSERSIYLFNVPVAEGSLQIKSITPSAPILAHETSVYKLFFDGDGDLWTASADKTAKHLVREEGWKADTTLTHPDFVRDVAVHERGGWVVTACRDEEVRVWNRATGALHHTFSGHYEEVTGLCLVGDLVVSVSIDATARRWSLAPAELERARQEARDPRKGQELEEMRAPAEGMLTEEEERELRELMESEETDLHDRIAEDLQ